MSIFTKRRKIVRKKREKQLQQWDENIKKSEKNMNYILKTCEVIDKEHPEFESLNEEERAKLFGKIYDEIRHDT